MLRHSFFFPKIRTYVRAGRSVAGRIVRILVHKKVLTKLKIIVIIRYQKKGEMEMTEYEKIMIELDVVRTIAFADGDSIEEKIYNAIDVLRTQVKRELEKEKTK